MKLQLAFALFILLTLIGLIGVSRQSFIMEGENRAFHRAYDSCEIQLNVLIKRKHK